MANSEAEVLIVEDEPHMRRFLRTTLTHQEYRVSEAVSGNAALERVFAGNTDLVLLDLGLPDIDGADVTTRIRERSDVPIIVLSARDAAWSKIEVLDRGANDYVTKPFSAGELLARVRVALRASQGRPPKVTTTRMIGGLRVDLARREVFLRDPRGSTTIDGAPYREVTLTPNEYSLLLVLLHGEGAVVTHKRLLTEVWGPDSAEQVQYLRVYMRQLRYKLEPEPAQPKYLLTVSGIGYRLRSDA